jgi:hypothetical protein
MRKVVIALSEASLPGQFEEDVDYWVMEGALSANAVADARLRGIMMTVFDRIDSEDGNAISDAIAIATLHNSDWRELQISR